MDALTFEGIKTAVVVLLVILGAVGTIGKGLEVIASFRKPNKEKETATVQALEDHDEKLANDKRRLDAHEAQLGEMRRMMQVLCVAMKALLSHEINGNSIDKLKTANDQLDAYLIGVGK